MNTVLSLLAFLIGTFTDAGTPRLINAAQHASRVQHPDRDTRPRASNGRQTPGTRFAIVEDVVPIRAASN